MTLRRNVRASAGCGGPKRRSPVTQSRRCLSCYCRTTAGVLTTGRNSRQRAPTSVVPTVRQVAVAAASSDAAADAVALAVVAAPLICRRRCFVPECCTVLPTPAARCRPADRLAGNRPLSPGSSPAYTYTAKNCGFERYVTLAF